MTSISLNLYKRLMALADPDTLIKSLIASEWVKPVVFIITEDEVTATGYTFQGQPSQALHPYQRGEPVISSYPSPPGVI